MVAAGPRLPKPIGGDNGGDEPLRISLGEGMMGEARPRVQLCLLNCSAWWGRAPQAWTASGSRGRKQHGRCRRRRQLEAAPGRLARDICGRLPQARHSARRQPLRQPDVRELRSGASLWCNVELGQRRHRRDDRRSRFRAIPSDERPDAGFPWRVHGARHGHRRSLIGQSRDALQRRIAGFRV